MRQTRLLLLAFVPAIAAAVAIGCGESEQPADRDSARQTSTPGTGEAGTPSMPSPSTTADTQQSDPPEIDFQATGRKFVEALGSGDCEAAAGLQGWTEEGSNRDVAMSNCWLAGEDLGARGKPAAANTREEAQPDGATSVWVTLDYDDGSQWEMLMTFRVRRGEWVVTTYAYGESRPAD